MPHIFGGGAISWSIPDGTNLGIGTSTGTSIGAAGSKVSFFGVTPVGRSSAITQTYATASRTLAADTAVSAATTAATNVASFGYTTQAQADAVRAGVNALIVDMDNVKQVLNSVINDLRAYGLEQ